MGDAVKKGNISWDNPPEADRADTRLARHHLASLESISHRRRVYPPLAGSSPNVWAIRERHSQLPHRPGAKQERLSTPIQVVHA